MQQRHLLNIVGLMFCLQACGIILPSHSSELPFASRSITPATLSQSARPVSSTPTPMQKDRVQPVDRSEFAGFPQGQWLITTTSIWQNGSVPRLDGAPDYLFYVYADRPWDDAPPHLEAMSREWYEYLTKPPSATGHPSIGTSVFASGQDGLTYEHTWLCPQPIGALIITGISGGTGMAGVIAFSSLSGQTGSFDLRTQQWSFAARTSPTQ